MSKYKLSAIFIALSMLLSSTQPASASTSPKPEDFKALISKTPIKLNYGEAVYLDSIKGFAKNFGNPELKDSISKGEKFCSQYDDLEYQCLYNVGMYIVSQDISDPLKADRYCENSKATLDVLSSCYQGVWSTFFGASYFYAFSLRYNMTGKDVVSLCNKIKGAEKFNCESSSTERYGENKKLSKYGDFVAKSEFFGLCRTLPVNKKLACLSSLNFPGAPPRVNNQKGLAKITSYTPIVSKHISEYYDKKDNNSAIAMAKLKTLDAIKYAKDNCFKNTAIQQPCYFNLGVILVNKDLSSPKEALENCKKTPGQTFIPGQNHYPTRFCMSGVWVVFFTSKYITLFSKEFGLTAENIISFCNNTDHDVSLSCSQEMTNFVANQYSGNQPNFYFNLCSKLKDILTQDQCLYGFGKQVSLRNSKSLQLLVASCMKVSPYYYQNRCFSGGGQVLLNYDNGPSICDQYKLIDKDRCITGIGSAIAGTLHGLIGISSDGKNTLLSKSCALFKEKVSKCYNGAYEIFNLGRRLGRTSVDASAGRDITLNCPSTLKKFDFDACMYTYSISLSDQDILASHGANSINEVALSIGAGKGFTEGFLYYQKIFRIK